MNVDDFLSQFNTVHFKCLTTFSSQCTETTKDASKLDSLLCVKYKIISPIYLISIYLSYECYLMNFRTTRKGFVVMLPYLYFTLHYK